MPRGSWVILALISSMATRSVSLFLVMENRRQYEQKVVAQRMKQNESHDSFVLRVRKILGVWHKEFGTQATACS